MVGKKAATESDRNVAVKKGTKAAEAKAAGRALSPFEEMDLLFDRLSHGLMTRMGFPALGELGWPSYVSAPKVDIVDKGDKLLIRAEIPGVGKDDLHIELNDQSVTIRGETRKETSEEKGDYYRREISSGRFQRTLALPVAVQGDKANARFDNGLLEVVLPKASKPGGRKIRID